jgi:hypothetical protein
MNKEKPHLLVLPEDRANTQIVNGFLLDSAVDVRRLKVLKEAGGWGVVLKQFQNDYLRHLRMYPESHILLLIDFDNNPDRGTEARKSIPADLYERVFILGAKSTPEALKKALNIPFEEIGQGLAKDCQNENEGFWDHEHLKHNSDELARLRMRVSKFVFSG